MCVPESESISSYPRLLSYYVCHIRHKKRTAVVNEASIRQILETVNYVPILVAFVLINTGSHSKQSHMTLFTMRISSYQG